MDPEQPKNSSGDSYTVDDLADEFDDTDVEGDNMDLDKEEQYDNSQIIFPEHGDVVYVVDVDIEGKYVVSGGQDDKACVWELTTGQLHFEVKCKDTIAAVCFSADGAMVAIGDMSGIIKVYYVYSKKEIWNFETDDLNWLQWHPKAPVLLACTRSGNAWLWKIPSGEFKTFPSPGSPCECGCIMSDGKRAALAYADGSVRMVDLKSQEILHTTKAHKEGIVHVVCTGDGQTVISGALDGTTALTNSTTGKVFAMYHDKSEENKDANCSVEYVGYSESLSLVAVGCLDCYLYIWDIKSGNLRTKCKHPEGITCLKWDSKGLTVFTGCLDGKSRQWDARSGEIINTFVGHREEILAIAVTRNDSALVSVSADNLARVFEVCETPQSSS